MSYGIKFNTTFKLEIKYLIFSVCIQNQWNFFFFSLSSMHVFFIFNLKILFHNSYLKSSKLIKLYKTAISYLNKQKYSNKSLCWQPIHDQLRDKSALWISSQSSQKQVVNFQEIFIKANPFKVPPDKMSKINRRLPCNQFHRMQRGIWHMKQSRKCN